MSNLIRPVQEKDFEALIELFREFALFEKLPEKMTNSVEQMMKEKEFFNGYVAESEEKKIIGYATYFFSYHTWTGKSLYMDDLYVKEAHRHKGIGKKLLGAVIEFARKEKCHELRWQVSNWNKHARKFYKKIGATIDDVELNCVLSLK
ncbi:GNAT family N-acetyltransferase [Fulvivirga sp. M361]|uniref:GNAT family N-acetyltransferase n=1 Tax=Fulvivirga sp. M361 TaxID=2594266 RepID=UPI00117BCF09|nr:GNAT family N-acetyltransferase [Fulvivirga sp. M361]TRX58434.1 GNAT family N-acetyltransferase [Fulvivirga sp. M361]